jgi:hypothetical protein
MVLRRGQLRKGCGGGLLPYGPRFTELALSADAVIASEHHRLSACSDTEFVEDTRDDISHGLIADV